MLYVIMQYHHSIVQCSIDLRGARKHTYILINNQGIACAEAAADHISTHQSCQETLAPFASLSAISGTLNSGVRPISVLRFWIPEGLTQAES